MSCEPSTLAKGVALNRPFLKSGGFDTRDPRASEMQSFLIDPVLRLPPGTWHVYVVASFSVGDCGGERHELRADITIVVEEPAAASTESPVPTTVGPPSTRPPAAVALPYPDGCAAYGLSARRCASIVDSVREQAGLAEDEVASVELLGDPDCVDPGSGLCNTSAGSTFLVRVRLTADDGTATEQTLRCMLGSGYPCTEPEIGLPDLATSGFWDTPCNPGPAPAGCATPMPSIDPGAAAQAVPLTIEALDIEIDHEGRYQIELGTATLPNGQLSEASIRMVGTEGWLVIDGGLRLVVTSQDPTRPSFENAYHHGWYPGVEAVSVTLEFTVLEFDPGSVLSLTDILVR